MGTEIPNQRLVQHPQTKFHSNSYYFCLFFSLTKSTTLKKLINKVLFESLLYLTLAVIFIAPVGIRTLLLALALSDNFQVLEAYPDSYRHFVYVCAFIKLEKQGAFRPVASKNIRQMAPVNYQKLTMSGIGRSTRMACVSAKYQLSTAKCHISTGKQSDHGVRVRGDPTMYGQSKRK